MGFQKSYYTHVGSVPTAWRGRVWLGQHVSLPKKWVDVAVVFGIVTVLLGGCFPDRWMER